MSSFHETFTEFVTDFDQLPIPTGQKSVEFMEQVDLAKRCKDDLTKERFIAGAALFVCSLHEQLSIRIPNLEADDSIKIRRGYYDMVKDHPKYEKAIGLLASYEISGNPKQEMVSCNIVPSASRKLYLPITDEATEKFLAFVKDYDFTSCMGKKVLPVQLLTKEKLVERVDYVTWYVNPFTNVTDPADIFTGFYGIVPLYTRAFLRFFRQAIAEIIYDLDGVSLPTFTCVNNQILHAIQKDHLFMFIDGVHQLIASEGYKTIIARAGKSFDMKDKLYAAARGADLRFAPFLNGAMIAEVAKIINSIISQLRDVTSDTKKRDDFLGSLLAKANEYRGDNEESFLQAKEQIMDFVIDEWYAAKERRKARLAAADESSVDVPDFV